MKSETHEFQIVPIEECQINLDFEPDSLWPETLPLYSYKDELLCGFHRKKNSPHEKVIRVDKHSLIQYFKSIYPSLSFLELARFSEKGIKLSLITPDQNIELWSLYGFQYRDNLKILINKVLLLPLDIQRWLTQKKFAPQDLAPLRALNDLSLLEEYWDDILQANPSKTEGVKWIEWLVELLLMGHKKESLRPQIVNTTTPQSTLQWLQHLQGLRYPLSTKSDNSAEIKVRSLNWPSKSEVRWTRRGDRSGIELKMFFSNPEELKINTLRLEKISKEFDENSTLDEIWSKN